MYGHCKLQVAKNVVQELLAFEDDSAPVDVEAITRDYTMDCIARILYSAEPGAVKSKGKNQFSERADGLFDMWRLCVLTLNTYWELSI